MKNWVEATPESYEAWEALGEALSAALSGEYESDVQDGVTVSYTVGGFTIFLDEKMRHDELVGAYLDRKDRAEMEGAWNE